MNRVALAVLSAALLWPGPSGAGVLGVELLGRRSQSFVNDPSSCAADDTCALKGASLAWRKEIHTFDFGEGPDRNWFTRMWASYETRSVSDLERFAFVQFIRGCIFSERRDASGRSERSFHMSKTNFGRSLIFRFPEWTVDSQDSDPMYFTRDDIPGPRHYPYLVGVPLESDFSWSTVDYFGKGAPENPVLTVSDIPTMASLDPRKDADGTRWNEATNASLEFRTCLYRTADVPARSKPGETDFGKPIHCFDWDHSFVYDFKKRKFVQARGIDPFCSEPDQPLNLGLAREAAEGPRWRALRELSSFSERGLPLSP
jgi:hypothetical protein